LERKLALNPRIHCCLFSNLLEIVLTFHSHPTPISPPSHSSAQNQEEKEKSTEQDSRSIGISMAPPRLRRNRRKAALTQGGACCLAILSTRPHSLLPSPWGFAASCCSKWASQRELSCGKKHNSK
jgi:hypothetical protein